VHQKHPAARVATSKFLFSLIKIALLTCNARRIIN
jgi:hypothetical protein